MPLTLVTGPANAAKAAIVLEACRAAAARAPILVVPRAADVAHYRRELAGAGAALGPAVLAFGGLVREIARRAGVVDRPLGEVARERVLAGVVAATPLEVLEPATRAPGFASGLAQFVGELERSRIEPGRFAAALRAWAPQAASRRRRYAEELAALYGGYRRALERLGRLDAELHAVRAVETLRIEPWRWGRTPVFCYGFDDLEPLQLDVVETLAHRVGAPVTLSLPGEPGRVALAGRAATLETLRPSADEVVALPPAATYYEDPALHHLERSLFEDAPARVAPGRAVRLLEGGDERAEAELVAAAIAELVAEGYAPGDIAVVTRGPERVAALIARALAVAEIPHTRPRRERFADTAVGGGLLALLRVASRAGEAADLTRWLRVPGVVTNVELVDGFEAALLRDGTTALEAARARWVGEHWPLDAAERVRAAIGGGSAGLLDRLERELDAMLAAPARRAAAPLDASQAAAVAAARRALAELGELAGVPGGVSLNVAAVTATLATLVVEQPAATSVDAVLICDALALRARRVRALFIAGVQEGALPGPAREPAFLSASERSELAHVAGLVLEAPLDALAAERSLFYALCSRPTARLAISWHDGTGGDGGAALRSLFVDDLADCFDVELETGRAVRTAGTVAWQGSAPAPPGPARLLCALEAPRQRGPVIGTVVPALLEALRGHAAHSPSALEAWAACPVAWFVERGLRLQALEPDRVELARGSAAHEALRGTLRAVAERTGSARLDARSLPVALDALDEALAAGGPPLSPRSSVARAEQRRLRSDLRRYLEFAAASGGAFEPRELELAFGMPGDPLPAVAVGEVSFCGRIDRVDVDPVTGAAIVLDYKTGPVDAVAQWSDAHRLQPALYMLAVERLLGVEAVAGLYQPLRSRDLRPRGLAREDVEAGIALFDNDRRDPESFRALLDAQRAVAVQAARELAAGQLRPRPHTCRSGGGCRHPTICRAEAR